MTNEIETTRELGVRVFSFGVITDTHLNKGEDDTSSPHEVNRLANRRMRHVIRDLNTRDLAFVVNVGDLIHPVPALPDLYNEAATRFHEQVKILRHELYLTPGNHDVGEKKNNWAPAAETCEAYLELWKQHFGPHYQSFDHEDCHFVIINAQIINSGLAAETEQRDWLEADLMANEGKRIFMHSHYPPYFVGPDEDENYDNLGEPGRSWLLGLLEAHAVEALFIGHVHNFWYNRYAATDCYLLPSTAFVRQDYSEMYHVRPGPDDEYGRNDKPKLGYFIAHVHEFGHVVEIVRTYGKEVEADALPSQTVNQIHPVHPRLNPHSALGFDMRQNWMEIVEIPPTGCVDEFDRKEVRNDYPLMGLLELGVRKLRVPFRDLLVPGACARMRDLRCQGFEFTLFTFGVPSTRDFNLIQANRDIFSAWEIVFRWDDLEPIAMCVEAAAHSIGIPIYLSRLRSIDEVRAEAGKYFHSINQGFLAADEQQMRGLLERVGGSIHGFVFRLTADRTPLTAIQEVAHLVRDLGVQASIHLRMCGSNPAETTEDDLWTANRIAEAMLVANAVDSVTVFADTYIDFDRGYFVRNGVLDRLNNPRLGYHILRNLHGWLAERGDLRIKGVEEDPNGRIVLASTEDELCALVLPSKAGFPPVSSREMIEKLMSNSDVKNISAVDLQLGTITSIETAEVDLMPARSSNVAPILFFTKRD